MGAFEIDDLFAALFGALLVGLILWQLISGKVIDARWRVAYTRAGRPLAYWTFLAAQAAIVAVYFVLRYT